MSSEDLRRIDPADCGCTDCLTGYSRPAKPGEAEGVLATASELRQDARIARLNYPTGFDQFYYDFATELAHEAAKTAEGRRVWAAALAAVREGVDS